MTKFFRNNKGQFLIASALLIAILFISVASLLTSTTLTNVKLLKNDFRKDTIQITSNFRGALALAITEVSKELELRSSMYNYENYSTLEEYSEAKTYGTKIMTSWQNTILQQYAGRSINLTITNLIFDCDWNSSAYYSKVSAVSYLDILTYGFYGFKQNVTSELELQIMDMSKHDNNFAFTIKLSKEEGLPVTDLEASFVKILYMRNSTTSFIEADPSNIRVAYLGSGVYNITFSAADYASPVKIKMILRDGRGIIVAAITKGGVLISSKEDNIGPVTTSVLANPNPCPKQSTTKLSATVDDTLTGANIIFSAEYFIDNANRENGEGTKMSLSDGYPDSPKENFVVQLNVASLASGNHTLYVHGMDAIGNWGNYSSVVIKVTDNLPAMHISDIQVSATHGRWSYIHGQATVTVVDATGKHVAGATVYGHWSGSVSGSAFGQTGTNGKVTFSSMEIYYMGGWFSRRLTFTFTVDNIIKTGWIYDKSANVKTSDTDYYP
jgi:hypothetical protein